MLMALSRSFQQLINDQTQHKEPLSPIQTCNSILWAVTQCSLTLGEGRREKHDYGIGGRCCWVIGTKETTPKFFYFYDDKPKCASPGQETSGNQGKNLHIVFVLVCP